MTSFNPLLIIFGLLLTGIAIFTALEMIAHYRSANYNHNFLFFGVAFSLSIGIWMMSFFGMISLDITDSTDRLIFMSFISGIISYLFSCFAVVFLLNYHKKSNINIGSMILSFVIVLTILVEFHVYGKELDFNIPLIVITYCIVVLFVGFSLHIVLSPNAMASPYAAWRRFLASIIITIGVGQAFILLIKATDVIGDTNSSIFKITLNELWFPYMIIALLITGVVGLVVGTSSANRNIGLTNMYTKDIITALNASSIVCVADVKGHISYVNQKCIDVSGYSNEQLIGHNIDIFINHIHNQSLLEEILHSLKNKEIWKGEISFDSKVNRTIWMDVSIIPFMDKKGKVYQYAAVCVDITKRKLMEQELFSTFKEIEDYKYALDASSIVAITDAKGIITSVNENFCRISKYSKEELVGADHRILNSGYHSKDFMKELWRTIGKGHVWQGEIRNKAKDGTYYWVETTIVPFLNEKNKPYKYLSIRNDITEKKRQEEILQRQEKLSALGQLAAGVAHEIRNPLTSMKGYTEFLAMDELDETRKEHFNIILDEIERVNHIVEDFMVLSKPETNVMAQRNIAAIVSHSVTLFSYVAKKQKVNVTFETEEPDMEIICDENRLKQVFVNLIKNSIEAMPKGGLLKVTVEKEDNMAKITICDTGVGITPEQMKKMGEPFYTTKETGTGLGLMMSFKIIEAHNGTMCFDSVENKGTSFIISLPLIK